MFPEIIKNQVDFDDAVISTFFISQEHENLFHVYMLEYNKNILFLRFNDYISDTDKCDWLLNYCESLSEKIHSPKECFVELREQKLRPENNSIGKILLILDRDFHKSIRKDSEKLFKYKLLDNVLLKYSDRLSKSICAIGGELSLVEIILRLHELYKYGKAKYLIIYQFEKLMDVNEHLSNEARSIIYSYIYSLITNIRIGTQDGQELKIIIID
ncbi:hypothetical protein OJ253_3555 [Cryptosporidium canis]|uniref:Uncharacterized protein n=1 Tax=Cryptosporidium canis TaxID=195482 RepID=A0A9D5HX67_9CRYT|nr:hypothetical protein OJ253_3555 [Cryptosporidium canis]